MTRTIADLVRDAVARGIVDRISWSSYQRLLADVDLRPHRIQGWVHSPDPEFRAKVTDIHFNDQGHRIVGAELQYLIDAVIEAEQLRDSGRLVGTRTTRRIRPILMQTD